MEGRLRYACLFLQPGFCPDAPGFVGLQVQHPQAVTDVCPLSGAPEQEFRHLRVVDEVVKVVAGTQQRVGKVRAGAGIW